MIDYERELNEEQRRVVMEQGGPLLVIAGAGSGKTRTLTYRVARLIESGVRPEHILLATFTNKAARSMLTRVKTHYAGHCPFVGRNLSSHCPSDSENEQPSAGL
jgi:DNA helicase-2/ATP-dependent DNA helicase PcrA